MRCLLLALIVFSTCCDALAQRRKRPLANFFDVTGYRGNVRLNKGAFYGSICASINSLNYFGDLAPRPNLLSTDISFTRPSLTIGWSYKFGARVSVLAKGTVGTIKGSDNVSAKDVFRERRNLSFRNRLKGFSLQMEWDLLKNYGYYHNRPPITPFVLVGGGLIISNPQAIAPETDLQGRPLERAGEWVNLRSLGTEGQRSRLQNGDVNNGIKPYSLIQPTVCAGIGVEVKINSALDFRSEFTAYYFFTDYLDDVSRNYVDLGALPNELSRAMSYRTNELGQQAATHQYVGRDGVQYSVVAGYGSEHRDNLRGKRAENDAVFSFSVGIAYIIRPRLHTPRYRN